MKKSLVFLAALLGVCVFAGPQTSTAEAHWHRVYYGAPVYYAPRRVVYSAPVVVPAPVVVQAPVYAPAPVYYGAPVIRRTLVPRPVYVAPYPGFYAPAWGW